MTYKEIIGKNVRLHRKEMDLTISELSKIIGIADGFLGLIERGERGTSLENIVRISEFFNISLDEFVKTDLSLKKVKSNKKYKRKELLLRLVDILSSEEIEFTISILIRLQKISKKGE